MSIEISKIKLNPEYNTYLPPLAREEYEKLKQSIEENGLYHPIIVNKDGTILDGHQRYKACKELGIEPRLEVKEFKNEYEEKIFVFEVNIRRRQLNDFQLAEVGMKILQIEQELAKQRQLKGTSARWLAGCLLSTQEYSYAQILFEVFQHC